MKLIGLAQGQSQVDTFSFVRDDGSTLILSPEDVRQLYNSMLPRDTQNIADSTSVMPVSQVLERLEVFRRLTKLEKEMETVMNLVTVDKDQVDAVQAAVATLTTDVSTALTAQASELQDQSTALQDIAAKLASMVSAAADPTTATELTGILTGVQGVDTSVQTMIANVKTLDTNIKAADPGPITPVTPTPAPTPASSSVDAGGASHTVVESTPGGNAVTPKTTA